MGYKKINRNFFKKKIQKGLPKYQNKGETGVSNAAAEGVKNVADTITPVISESQNVFMSGDSDGTGNVYDMPTDRGVDPDMYMEGDGLSDEERALLIQKQLDMMNFANESAKASAMMNNPKMGYVQDVNANLIESGPTENDIIMEALKQGKKVKLRKDGTIKKIKKTGGIVKGKFLRRGGITGRKFL
tara:strand:+ start:667 stop:1227 length:561 start_codon:yes stop_codon:yes gene_type:complete